MNKYCKVPVWLYTCLCVCTEILGLILFVKSIHAIERGIMEKRKNKEKSEVCYKPRYSKMEKMDITD